MPATQPLRLTLLPGELVVYRLPADAPVPASIFAASASATGFVSVTRTGDELSIVCAAAGSAIAADAENVKCATGYRALKVLGPLAFDVVGVMAALSSAIAAAGISILAIATYDTDYILVHENDVERAIAALRHDGHTVD